MPELRLSGQKVFVISRSVRDTLNIGRKIAKNLLAGDIICLFGSLGSGKTVLTKGIAKGLGIKDNKIISPSFVLARQYSQGRVSLLHLDLYRLKSPKEILLLGYEEYLYADSITVIEWADRLEYLLPLEFLKIKLSIKTDSQRLLEFQAKGSHYEALQDRIYEDIRN